MTRWHRRLAALEQALQPTPMEEPVIALALDTGGDDLMAVGGEWLPCPDVAAVFARCDGRLKVYGGFDPREMLACPARD